MGQLTRHRLSVPVLGLFAVVLVLGGAVLGVTNVQSQNDRTSIPSVAVYPAVAQLHASTAVVLLGSGFEPGEEVTVLLGDTLGVLTDLGSSSGFLNPAVVADESGNFASKFQVGRMERVSSEQAWSITVMDADATEVLATAPMAFLRPPRPEPQSPLSQRGARLRGEPRRPQACAPLPGSA